MTFHIASVDLHYIIKEATQLKEARVQNVYQPDGNSIIFSLYCLGKKYFLNITSTSLWISEEKQEMPERAQGFCLLLRKYLKGASLKDIQLAGLERFFSILFVSPRGKYLLNTELYGKGNVILCSPDGAVIGAVNRNSITGNNYATPEIRRAKKFIAGSPSSTGNTILDTLASESGFGKKYAKEICARAELNGNEKELSEKDAERLNEESGRITENSISPFAVSKNGIITDAIPFPFASIPSENCLPCKTFSEAIMKASELERKTQTKQLNKKTEKFRTAIESQNKHMTKLKMIYESNQRKGELLYEHYAKVESLVKEIEERRKTQSWEEIKKTFSNSILKEINEADSTITIELE